MNLTDDERSALRHEFADEVPRHRAALHDALRALEEAGRDGTGEEALARLHAEAHAVRGVAALIGLVELAERARLLERAASGTTAERATAADHAGRLIAALGAQRPAGRDSDPGTAPDRPLVLHVEDNEANRRLLAAVMAHRPHLGLLEAASGEEGVELARTPGIVLVLLDLRLPGLSGEEVLALLRADPVTAGLRVVVVSAEARVDERDRLFAAGADDYIVKPYDVEHLLATLDAALAARPR